MSNYRTAASVGVGLAILAAMAAAFHVVGGAHARRMAGTQAADANCLPCHAYAQQEGPLGELFQREYLDPLELAVSPEGDRLYVTAQAAGALLVLDPEAGSVVDSIAVGRRPHGVALSPDGETAYVSNRWSHSVSIVDLEAGAETDTVEVGGEPTGLAVGSRGERLYVSNSASGDVSVVDLGSRRETRRFRAGRSPAGVAVSPDGGRVRVTSLQTRRGAREVPVTEVTVFDAEAGQVVRRPGLRSAHMVENAAYSPSGDLVLTTLTRPKNLVPATQVGQGWMLTYGLGVLDLEQGGRAQLLLDEPGAFYADPFDVVVGPEGRRAFVSHSGADVVSVVDLDSVRTLVRGGPSSGHAPLANDLGLSARFVTTRIPTGSNPKGLALSPAGDRLYVAERLEDRVAVVATETMEVVRTIDLGGPEEETFVRRGAKLFHGADHSFQGQFSCWSCHPDGQDDGLTYDLEPDGLGKNIVNNVSLRGLEGTSPFKWTGTNLSLYRQCGFRFAKWLTRTEPFALEDLYALVAYIRSLERPPNLHRRPGGELTPDQRRGKRIYERTTANSGETIPVKERCVTCHPAPRYTDRRRSDVGTSAPTDTKTEFDTPRLDNLYAQAPYLHDGKAATLEEIWTKYNPEDRHGVTNDLTKLQLNDLVKYLKTLGGAPNEREEAHRP